MRVDTTYEDFLRRKVRVAAKHGFAVQAEDVHPILLPHQRDAVRWACAGGRRALFEAFGLGKSVQQIEVLRLCQQHAGGPVLIVLPLGVRQEFRRDADMLVRKEKAQYTRARWQVDAHAFWRSSGQRQLTADELAQLGPDKLAKLYTEYSLRDVYSYETHVRIGEELEARGALPSTFMSLAPGSHHPDVWHDVNRMLTLNGEQTKRGLENHICPLQFDIVDRLIERFSNRGELVFDPFGGLFTVPYRALKLGRHGRAVELSAPYFLDGVRYLEAMERQLSMPSLFDAVNDDTGEVERAA